MLDVRCPVCGSSFEVGTNGQVVDPCSCDGIAYAKVKEVRNENAKDVKEKKMTKEEQRNAALLKYGYNPALFTSATIGGKTFTLKKDENGNLSECEDPIVKKIFDNGYHWSSRDDGRYVFVDTMRLLTSKAGWTDTVNSYSYMWQFDILIRSFNEKRVNDDKYHKRYCELKKLAREEVRDPEYFRSRVRFFNRDVLEDLLEDYFREVKKEVEKTKQVEKHMFRNRIQYTHICGKDIFIDDIDKFIYRPIRECFYVVKTSATYKEIYEAFNKLIKNPFFVEVKADKCPMFVDAYKGLGAYYSLRNLIMTKNCVCRDEHGHVFDKYESLDYVEKVVDESYVNHELYKVQGLLKDVIKFNKYDFGADKLTW